MSFFSRLLGGGGGVPVSSTAAEEGGENCQPLPESRATDIPIEPEEQEPSEEEEEEEEEEDEERAVGAVAKGLTKAQKKAQRRKAKDRERKALMAKSAILSLPTDELEPERHACLKTLLARLSAFPYLSQMKPADVLATYQEQRRMLEEFDEHVLAELKALSDRTKKPESRHISANILTDEIRELEMASEPKDELIQWKITELLAVRSMEHQRAFATSIKELRKKIEDRMAANDKAVRLARDWDKRRHIVERLVALRQSIEPSFEMPADAQVKSVALEVSPALSSFLYQPTNGSRRVERMFKVVFDAQYAPQPTATTTANQFRVSENEGNFQRGPRGNPRSINVWGFEADAEAAASFIASGDFSGKQRKTYERRMVPAIIGRAGANLRAMESQFKCLVDVDKNTDVVVFGSPEAATGVFAKVDAIKVEQQDVSAFRDVVVDSHIARALQQHHTSKMRGVETSFKGNIRVFYNQQDNTARINVRARADALDQAVKAVEQQLVQGFTILKFEAPIRAFNRLLFPPRTQGTENSNLKMLHEEFTSMRSSLALYVTRLNKDGQPNFGPRNRDGQTESPTTTERSENYTGLEPSTLIVVAAVIDVESVKDRIESLVKRANYATSRMTIERDQLNIFTPENRALVEHSSGIRFSHYMGGGGGARQGGPPGGGERRLFNQQVQLILQGTEEEIEAARKIVEDILVKEGSTLLVKFELNETIVNLIKDRGAKIKELEANHGVALTLYRESLSARLVGHRDAVEDAASDLKTLEEGIKAAQAKLQTARVPVDSRRVGRVLGRGGATIRQIREDSGVLSIQIEDDYVKPETETETQNWTPVAANVEAPAKEEGTAEVDDSEAAVPEVSETETAVAPVVAVKMSVIVVRGEEHCVKAAVAMIEQIIASWENNNNQRNDIVVGSQGLERVSVGERRQGQAPYGGGRGRGRGAAFRGEPQTTTTAPTRAPPTESLQSENDAKLEDGGEGLWSSSSASGAPLAAATVPRTGRGRGYAGRAAQHKPAFNDEGEFPSLASAAAAVVAP